MTMHALPALQRSLAEIVEEYEQKVENVPALCNEYKDFYSRIDSQTTIGASYVGRVYSHHPSLSENTCREKLKESAWQHVYKGLNIHRIASAKDRKQFEMALQNPPDFTLDNIRATFGDYIMQPRFHILKGLAECFVELDPAFKSHSKIKVGVAGLPKRIILSSVVRDYGLEGYGGERLKDTLNAIRVYEGKQHLEYVEFRDFLEKAYKQGEAQLEGMRLKVFKNGNGHLIFGPDKLRMINKALAEFYGEVLADVSDDGEVERRKTGTAVSKDLQFYPTPRKVIDQILSRTLDLREDLKVLEPSCGDGAIMEALLEKNPNIDLIGIEYHSARAAAAKAKGLRVARGNFLELPPQPIYDLVVMNPPFYGTHWKQHLEHAMKFLKPPLKDRPFKRGHVVCILPATAFYDGHLGKMGLVREDAHVRERGWVDSGWTDLPVGSFAESGTNVPTGYIHVGAR
jgi:hypothetical protein